MIHFDLGWSALPPNIRDIWSSRGIGPDADVSKPRGAEHWNGWADAVRNMFSRNVEAKTIQILQSRASWRGYVQNLNASAFPDITPVIDPRLQGQGKSDTLLVLEAFYLMREWSAINEFAVRWRTEEDRKKLWNEIVEFWGYGEVYPAPPPVTELEDPNEGLQPGVSGR
jgi:hypothetical protein